MEAALLSLGIAPSTPAPTTPRPAARSNASTRPSRSTSTPKTPSATRKQLQAVLDRFATYYNHDRPHRALGRRTPAEAYTAGVKAFPTGPMINVAGYRVRHRWSVMTRW